MGLMEPEVSPSAGKRDGTPRMQTNNRHETNGVEVRVHWEPVGE